jgi:RND superfamily putative drug exporter
MTWSYDRRRRVVALWIAALVAASVLAGVAGGDSEADYTVPGSDSAEAVELLQERFPRFAGGTVDVVYTAADGVTGPDTAARIDALAVTSPGSTTSSPPSPGRSPPTARPGW